MKWLIIPLTALLLSGCADTHQLNKDVSLTTSLSPHDTIFIGVPVNGFYGDKTYTGSGKMTTQILAAAFSSHARNVRVDQEPRSLTESLVAARKAGARYLVFPTILHWEDRATEWSGIPDKVSLKIEVIDLATEQPVASAVVKGKSGLATFGGDHPQDLLPEPVNEFVASLY